MPKNRFIYFGILIVAASALLWLGYQITNIALQILPWSASLGIVLIIIGIFIEARKPKEPQAEEPKEGE